MGRIPEERPRRLFLRKMRDQARLEGLAASGWSDDDYAVVASSDDTRVGRIYKELIDGTAMWRWSLQTEPAPPPSQGIAHSLEEAEVDFTRRYQEVCRK
jgi:hypothetical protein